MFGIGFQELVVILLICLLLFGASRLPEIGRALGKGIQEFKKSTKEGLDENNGDKKGNDEQKS
ncbi:MAG: twin-arginine translocase TatA/TatE family subunit [Candidatus Omnitrophica bacterium]|nr:twin-arginine translocase TatA/TatE family subunit [Candidatus Omnitrophota bacterium]